MRRSGHTRLRLAAAEDERRQPDSQELLAPAFEVEQRPNQQTAVLRARQVLVDEGGDGVSIEAIVDACVIVQKASPDVIDAFALEPARVGRRKPLLFAFADLD